MILLHLFITPLRIPSSLFRLACLSLLFHSVVSVQSFVAVWVFCLCLSVKFVGESLLSLFGFFLYQFVKLSLLVCSSLTSQCYEIQFICVQFLRCLLSFLSFSLGYLFPQLVSVPCRVVLFLYCSRYCLLWWLFSVVPTVPSRRSSQCSPSIRVAVTHHTNWKSNIWKPCFHFFYHYFPFSSIPLITQESHWLFPTVDLFLLCLV